VHGEKLMQSRAVREGSVGLMLIAGLGIFVAAGLWLRGLGPGSQKYNIVAQFEEAAGIQQGGAVRYRGIRVGKIASIKTAENGVEVTLEISDPSLKIPKNSIAEVSQTGLIGEPVIEITPQEKVTLSPDLAKAVDSNCDANAILCNNSQLSGRAGASFNELLRRATALVNRYESPEIVDGLKKTLANASQAAADISILSKKFGDLPDSIKKELGTVSASASSLTKSLDVTVKNANGAITKVGNATDKISATTDKFGATADSFNKTATGINTTAADYSKLAKSVDALLTENRTTFKTTLENFSTLSVDLRKTVNSLDPTISKLNTTVSKIDSEALAKDLKGVLANANQAAANLKNISDSFNNPQTLVTLQQTLDSARITFQNVQKITADLDEVTGDPNFRNNVKKLVNGLGQLVSSGETLEQQIKLAHDLEPTNRLLANTSEELARNYPNLTITIDPTVTNLPIKAKTKK
jgi:phospholipid/cholesterol/gamma-HCH transport system substrate-binding protein